MTRRLAPAFLAVAMLALIVAGTSSAAKAPSFKPGTYKGATATGAAVRLELKKATCDSKRQVNTQVKGFCFKLDSFPTPLSAHCPDGSSQTDDVFPYDVHISPKGKFSDKQETFAGSSSTPYKVLTFKLAATGKKVTGSVRLDATSDAALSAGSTSYDCTSGTIAFTAKR